MRRLSTAIAALLLLLAAAEASAEIIKFVYVSDSHYGLTREFRGNPAATSAEVNRALLEAVNSLPAVELPSDGGVAAGDTVGEVDFVVNTGDIANRMEKGVQSAARSWAQFEADWYGFLSLRDKQGRPSPLYLLPGNHDASNAVGYTKPMVPETDATAMAEIYNRMMRPAVPATAGTFDYVADKVDYSFTLAGVHFLFTQMWPDSRSRRWIEADLAAVADSVPVLLFTHDQPDVEAKHFVNPHKGHTINGVDRFENLLADTSSVASPKAVPALERQALADFLVAHPAIKAYFHGNENFSQFYTWVDPSGRSVIPVFRVDSPMKGELSADDESRLSFMVVCVDTVARRLTARECLWNAGAAVEWGASATIPL